MPTVPIYEPRRAAISGSLPEGRQPDTAVPRAAQGLFSAVADVGAKMAEENDRARAKSATNQFRANARERFSEMKQRKGGNANGAVEEYQKWYEDETKKFSGTLGTQRQQEIFNERANTIGQSDLDSLSVHEAQEHQKFRQSALAGSIATWGAEVMSNPSEGNLKLAEADIREGYEDVYAGIDKTAEVQKQIASVYVSAIQALQDADPQAAAAAIEKYKEKLGGAYFALKDGVSASLTKAQSQQAADLIIGTVPAEDQLKTARSISDADVRDQTVTRVKIRQQEQAAAAKAREAELMDSLTEDILNAGGYEAALDIADETEGKNRKKLIDLADSVYKGTDKTDYVAFAQAFEDIDTGKIVNAEQLALEYRSKMKPGDFEETLKYLNGGGNVAGVKDGTVRSIFKQYTDDKPDTPSGGKLYHKVWTYVIENLEPGKKPTNDYLSKLVGEALTQGEAMSGKWFLPDKDLTYIEAAEQGKGDQWLPEVESAEEDTIDQALQDLGKKVSETNRRLYKKHIIMGIKYKNEGEPTRYPINRSKK